MPLKPLHKHDLVAIGFLAFLALFIWLRDTRWMVDAADTLPILIALPLFFWLGAPWKLSSDEPSFPLLHVALATLLLLLGILTNFTWALTLGWCWMLWAFLRQRLEMNQRAKLNRLMVLPLMAFPWIILDGETLSWWFRLSGAWVTGLVLQLFGFLVSQEGTNLFVGTIPISVEPACSGLKTLQAMLIAGTLLAYTFLGTSWRYWPNLVLLVVIAWIANTIRVIALSLATIYAGSEFAQGAFHNWGGWFILMLMFLMCWGLFYVQRTPINAKPSSIS